MHFVLDPARQTMYKRNVTTTVKHFFASNPDAIQVIGALAAHGTLFSRMIRRGHAPNPFVESLGPSRDRMFRDKIDQKIVDLLANETVNTECRSKAIDVLAILTSDSK